MKPSDVAANIQARYDELHSWRKVSRLYYPTIPAGTLDTIVKSKGKRIPKKHWKTLGLVKERKRADEHTKFIRRKIRKMAKEVEKALEIR